MQMKGFSCFLLRLLTYFTLINNPQTAERSISPVRHELTEAAYARSIRDDAISSYIPPANMSGTGAPLSGRAVLSAQPYGKKTVST